ncbi:uncharacterized protein LOC133180845 [Saccostrea echinata]|uniref:uncharacterized protein LOC133180845 n=1 Tax=Saccostrea echinata TaxID=191078 RepID=UPI002A821FDD|nr:uncharacterized protein LOC133180845 [Saccostrea echinata]
MDCVKYLALLFALLSVSMVTMADDSSEDVDEDNDGAENEAEEEEATTIIEETPSASSTVIQSGGSNVGSTVVQTGRSNVVVTTYGAVPKINTESKSATKAKATISKVTKKVNRIVAFHRQRATFYKCQTSCLVGAISCLNSCRNEGAYTFYRDQYMLCGRKCRFSQYHCKVGCKNELRQIRTEQMRSLRA